MSFFMTDPAFAMFCPHAVTQSFSVLHRIASMDLFQGPLQFSIVGAPVSHHDIGHISD
jgi:hypothetical protein